LRQGFGKYAFDQARETLANLQDPNIYSQIEVKENLGLFKQKRRREFDSIVTKLAISRIWTFHGARCLN
jgi:ABC-type molybdate transport system ATPase subunit